MLIPATAPGPSPVSLAGVELLVKEEAREDVGFEEDVLGDFEGVLLLVVVVDGLSVVVEVIASVVEVRPNILLR